MPYRAFGTDITYLYGGNEQRSYLSIVKDLASSEIVAHRVSASLGMDLSPAISVIDQYINDYNHFRCQWEREKMAPIEYRNHLLAG